MANVVSKKCSRHDRNEQLSYSVAAGSKKIEFCSEHRKTGMVDVKNRKCAKHGGSTKVAVIWKCRQQKRGVLL